MPIRIGVQVDSGNKIGKLAKDLNSMGDSTEKVAGGSKKMAAGLKTAGTAVGSLAKQAVSAEKSAQKLYETWRKFNKLSPKDEKFSKLKKEFQEAKIAADQLALSIKKSRDEYYKFAQVRPGKSPKLTKEYKKVIDLEAEEKARKMLEQSEGRYATALAKSIALKEKGYQASLKRVAGAEKEAAALAKLVAMGVKLDSSTTGVKQLERIQKREAATQKLIATEKRLNTVRTNVKRYLWEQQREQDLRKTTIAANIAAAAEKKLQAARASAQASAAQRMSMSASGSTISSSKMEAMKASALKATNVELDKHGKLVGKTTQEYKKMNAVMRGAAGGFGKLWMSYGGNMAGMTAGFAAAAGAMASFKQSMDFEYWTTYASAIEESTISLEGLQKGLLEIRGVAAGPIELAEGMRELVKAGEDAGEALKSGALQTMSKFATIAGEDISTAIQLAVTQVNAFGDSTKKSEGYILDYATAANQMVAAVFSAPITFQDLQQSLKHTTELAVIAGVSFDEVTTALSIMGEAGIKGSMAGTALRTGLEKLVTPTDKLSAQFKSLGINLKDAFDDDGTMNVKEALGVYKDAYKQLDALSKVKFIKDTFGLRSQKAIAAMMKELDKWDDKNKKIQDSSGKIEAAYAKVQSTLKIAGTEFKNAFMADALKKLVPELSKLSAILRGATKHTELMVGAITLAVKATGLLIAAWGMNKLGAAIKAATALVLKFNAATLFSGATASAGKAGTIAGLSFGTKFIAGVGTALVGWEVGKYFAKEVEKTNARTAKALEKGSSQQQAHAKRQLQIAENDVKKFQAKLDLAKDGGFFGVNAKKVEKYTTKLKEAKIALEAHAAVVKENYNIESGVFHMPDPDKDPLMKEIEKKPEWFNEQYADPLLPGSSSEYLNQALANTETLAAAAVKSYKDAISEISKFDKDMFDKFGDYEDEEIEIGFELTAKDTTEADALLAKYKQLFKDSRGGKVAGSGKQLAAIAKEYQEIDTEKERMQKAQLSRAKELEGMAGIAAQKGVDGYKEQITYLEKARAIYESMDTSVDKVTKKQVAAAKKQYEWQMKITGGGKRAYGDAGKAFDKAKADYIRLAKAEREGKADPKAETSALKTQLKQLKANTAAQKAASEQHRAALVANKEQIKADMIDSYGDNKKVIAAMVADSAGTINNFHKAWISDIDKIGEAYGKVEVTKGGARTIPDLVVSNPETGQSNMDQLELGKVALIGDEEINAAREKVDKFHQEWVQDIQVVEGAYGQVSLTKPIKGGYEVTSSEVGKKAGEEQLKLGKKAVAEEKKLAAAKQQTGQVAAKTATESAAAVEAAKDQTRISQEAADKIVAENDQINAAVAGATELIVKIGNEWTNVAGKIEAAKTETGNAEKAAGDAGTAAEAANDAWIGTVQDLIKFYGDLTKEINAASAAAASGNYGAGATGGARAAGGPVSSDKSYIVGEKGPELFSPTSSGYIIPNNKLTTNGENVNINLSVNDSPPVTVQGTAQSARDIAAMFNKQQRLASG